MKKKYKATAALAISMAGAAGTTGIAHTGFLGGMVHNGFLAATIGGLADWFAITALFHKPLGISYRTEIIVRNRQRIMQAVVDFAADDLLGADNIMRFVSQQDLGKFLGDFVEHYGQRRLMPYIGSICQLVQEQLDAKSLAQEIAPVVHDIAGEKFLSQVARDMLEGLSDKEMSRRLIHVLAAGMEELLKDKELQKLIAGHIEQLLQEYSDESTSRSFLMGMLGLSGEMLAEQLWKKAHRWLESLAEDADTEKKAAAWLSDKLVELGQKPESMQVLTNILQKKLTQEKIESMVEELLENILSRGVLAEQLGRFIQESMEKFARDSQWQQRADIWLKSWLAEEIHSRHDVIVNMIQERLGKLSDEELVEFTESKVADDLQMIRINGSVVGSLVGMALYAIVYFTGQVLAP